MQRIRCALPLAALLTLTITQTLPGQEAAATVDSADPAQTSIYPDIPQFGGPTSVGGQIAEDAALAPQFRWQGLQDHFQPWFDFKQRVNESCGIQFNIDESILYDHLERLKNLRKPED